LHKDNWGVLSTKSGAQDTSAVSTGNRDELRRSQVRTGIVRKKRAKTDAKKKGDARNEAPWKIQQVKKAAQID